jgi:hypothetical protein
MGGQIGPNIMVDDGNLTAFIIRYRFIILAFEELQQNIMTQVPLAAHGMESGATSLLSPCFEP